MPETYGGYSLMAGQRAGQLWVPGAPSASTQWSWAPQPDGTSQIAWGDPAAWPPPTFETFRADPTTNWAYLLGYGDLTGQWLPQVITAEWIGDAAGANWTPLPLDPDGRQHYARWVIPASGYSLYAVGYMDWAGARIDFVHEQRWAAPKTVSNAYFTNRRCIVQSEKWSDNAGHPGSDLFPKIDRDQYIALSATTQSLGMGFRIVDRLARWSADLRYGWAWG